MSDFKAIYFDGKSSKAHQVRVSESIGNLIIVSLDGSKSSEWELDEIRSESFSTGNKILLSYGDFPFERLELTGAGTDAFMENVLKRESKVKQYQHKITRARAIPLVLGSLVVLVLTVYSYVFHVSPYVGEQAVKIIPLSIEEKVGQAMYNNMSFFVDVDSVKSELLTEFYEACGFESDYNIRLDYSSSDMVNAFAVPGGQIVVFEGLIRETECWDELAALLGHELAHVNERHSFKQLARSVTGYLLLSVLTGDVAGASGVLLENASQVNEMANSRKHEKEADMVGLEYLKQSRIRPQAMMDLFSRLMEHTEYDYDNDEDKDEEEDIENVGDEDDNSAEEVLVVKADSDIEPSDDSSVAKGKRRFEKTMEYFSTHPSTGDRVQYIEEQISSDDSFNYTHAENKRAEEIWLRLKDEIKTESFLLRALKKTLTKEEVQDSDVN